MVKPPANWGNSTPDIKSSPNGDCGLKCPHCGNKDPNEFMRPMGEVNPVCLSCNKSIQV
jgi:hypothetical protein